MRYIEVKNLNCKLYGPKYHCRIKPVKIDNYIDTVYVFLLKFKHLSKTTLCFPSHHPYSIL